MSTKRNEDTSNMLTILAPKKRLSVPPTAAEKENWIEYNICLGFQVDNSITFKIKLLLLLSFYGYSF